MQYIHHLNYRDVDSVIEFLLENKSDYVGGQSDSTLTFHTYWHGPLGRKQLLSINSYLATQDLNATQLFVWLDNKCSYAAKNRTLIPRHENIQIKSYDPQIESKGTAFSNSHFVRQTKHVKFRSDCARLIFLFKHGGLYFDLDMILLRDLTSLTRVEFCYNWSDQNYGNNAILRLKKESMTAAKLMEKYNHVMAKHRFTNKMNSLIFTNDVDIYCFPAAFFDPVWILQDRGTESGYSRLKHFDQFFQFTDEDIKVMSFFSGAIFGYHWHSRNDANIEKNSYFEQLERDIDIRLSGHQS